MRQLFGTIAPDGVLTLRGGAFQSTNTLTDAGNLVMVGICDAHDHNARSGRRIAGRLRGAHRADHDLMSTRACILLIAGIERASQLNAGVPLANAAWYKSRLRPARRRTTASETTPDDDIYVRGPPIQRWTGTSSAADLVVDDAVTGTRQRSRSGLAFDQHSHGE